MILASSSCGLTSGITGNIMVHGKGVRREPQSSSIPTPRFKVLYNPEPIKSYSKKLFSQSYDGFPEIAAHGNASWKNSRTRRNFRAGKSTFKLKYVQRQQILILQCTESEKLRQGNRRSYDISIEYRSKRFLRLRYA